MGARAGARRGRPPQSRLRCPAAPGAAHATAPPALLPALRRVEAGGSLDTEEARVARLSVKTWAARRPEGGASASRVVDDARTAFLAALGVIEQRYGVVREEDE